MKRRKWSLHKGLWNLHSSRLIRYLARVDKGAFLNVSVDRRNELENVYFMQTQLN